MDFSEIYTQYIDDIRTNVQEFNDTVVKPYVQTNIPEVAAPDPEEKVIKKEVDHDHVPFSMKIFQRRCEKFSSYKKNQEYIRKQNAILHTQQVQKVQKDNK